MNLKTIVQRIAWIILSVILVVSLGGCGQPALTVETTPATEAKTSITIVIAEDPPGFNAAVSDTGYDFLVARLVLLGLTGIDPEGNIYPVLAAELPTLENGGVVENVEAGSMDVTWRLRSDIEWADGTPVTTDDVLFTYQALIDPNTGGWVEGLDMVESLEKIDAQTFVVHFNAIYPGYLTFLGGDKMVIWPSHYCDATQGFSAWDCARAPLSDGPYLLEEWLTGNHLIFTRNPNYYQTGKPEIDQVIVQIVPDETVRATMLAQGDADVLMWVTAQQIDELKTNSNVKVSISPYSYSVMRLVLNLAAEGSIDPVANPNPYFGDVRVRQAVRLAINIDLITENIFDGYSDPIWTEFFRPPYACDILQPKFDPEAAKALLEQAGWTDTDADGIRECHGCQYANDGDLLMTRFTTYAESGETLQLAQQLIAEMLGNVGFDLELSTEQGSILWADYASGGIEQRGDFNLDLYDDGYGGLDPTDFIRQYYYSVSAEPDQGWNVMRWENEEFDNLLDQVYTLDEAKRKELFCQMANILDDELPQILLFSSLTADAHSARLEGVQSNVNDIITWNIADWTLVK